MGKLKLVIIIIVWVIFGLFAAAVFYVNHAFPHGPSSSTGEVVCQNDDREPCGEEYEEDMGNLTIPDWAKWMRQNADFIAVLFLVGVLVSAWANNKNSSDS